MKQTAIPFIMKGKNNTPLNNAQQGREEQGEHQLHDGSAHVIEAYGERAEDVVAREYVQVVPEPDECPLADVLHLIEAEADHFPEGKIGEGEEEQEGYNDEGCDYEPLLPLLAFQIVDDSFAFHTIGS